jgi:hypothetical protein
MKITKVVSMAVIALSLGAFGAIATAGEHKGHSAMSMEMAHEPHHVLAMAYQRNLAIFAKALHKQTTGASSVNLEFARAAVAEMRRSFDQMKQHHQACMQAMSAEMKGTMEKMEPHQKQLNDQLTALEQEAQSAAPDAKKVATLASTVVTHLDEMSKMHHGSEGKKRKM